MSSIPISSPTADNSVLFSLIQNIVVSIKFKTCVNVNVCSY